LDDSPTVRSNENLVKPGLAENNDENTDSNSMKPENENELRDDEEEEFEFDDALLDELEV